MESRTIINTIRHAETQYNCEKRYAGSIDISLNEQGIITSKKAAIELAEYHFDVVIGSTLTRTTETAKLLVSDATPIVKSKLCVERNFGIFEGLTYEEVQNIQPPILWIEVGNDKHSVNPPGGEPFEKVWERAIKFRNWLFRKYDGCNILVVSHGTFLQLFHGLLRGMSCIESLAYYPANLQLETFVFEDRRLVDEKRTKLGGTKLMRESDLTF